MKQSWVLLLSLAMVVSAFGVVHGDVRSGRASPKSATEYCSMSRSDFRSELFSPENQLGFPNDEGPLNIGLCWWYSKFLRSATYLSIYRPDLPKPTEAQANEILTRLIANSAVLEIPGYSDLSDFSTDFEPLVEKRLGEWQLVDSFLRQEWVLGLRAERLSPAKVKRNLDEIYGAVSTQNTIAFLMLKLPGLEAHAWLADDVVKTDQGYDLTVADSNFPGEMLPIHYQEGDTSIQLGDAADDEFFEGSIHGRGMTPYLERKVDMRRIAKTIHSFCAPLGGDGFSSQQ